MTAAAARSAAALCVLRRAVAGRRVLQVMLFLGGLLTVGFLYGGQAHATGLPDPASADAGTSAAQPDLSAPARELRRVAQDSVDSTKSTKAADGTPSVLPVPSGREVAEPVTDTGRGVVRTVVRSLTEPVTGALTGTPGGHLPVPLPTPGGGVGPGLTPQLPLERPVDESPDGFTAKNPAGKSDSARPSCALAVMVGPVGGYDSGLGRGRAEAAGKQPASAPAPAQVPGSPCNSTPGALQQSTETHTPRTGDQHAAVSAYGRPVALGSGAVRAAADAPTRERPRDILEFPG
ncbi:hypothetical protein AB0F96_13740 [Streptomyces sp. NPDC023998]|uniref:hypothetical protein n=1 Tax=Streptomyces sp. NPDC023998 TaxID=3154597 RepID=UPI0033DE6904